MKKNTAFVVAVLFVVILMAGTVWANDTHNRYSNYHQWYNWYANWMNRYYIQYRNMQPEIKAGTIMPQPGQRIPGSQEPVQTPGPTETSQLTVDEQGMISKVNQERVQHGLQPLEVDMPLVKLAREKANDMIVNNYFDHQSPTLGSPFDQMKAAGVKYLYAGENLAGSPTLERAHTGLMNSPGHRANILKDRYTHIGVGVIEGGPYGKMWVQMFIQKY